MSVAKEFTTDRNTDVKTAYSSIHSFLRIEGGEPSADGRGSAPPELAKQQAQAGSDAASATPPPLGAQSTFIPLHRWGGGVKVLLRYFLTRK